MNKFTFGEKLNGLMYLQGYGDSPEVYASLGVSGHIGVDISRGDGDPIKAIYDGTVVYADEPTGVLVYITDPDEDGRIAEISIGHCKQIRPLIGEKIKAGDFICTQWSTNYPDVDENDFDRIAWSHEHLNIRMGRRGERETRSLKWNWSSMSPISYSIDFTGNSLDDFIDPNKYSRQVVYLIAKAIEKKENMTKYHADNNNPGAIKSNQGSFLRFPTYEEGFKYLIRYLTRACTGEHAAYRPDMTVREFFSIYSPSFDHNDPLKYAKDIVEWVGLLSIDDPISDWMLTEIEWIKKYQKMPIIPYRDERSKLNEAIKSLRVLWNMFFKGR